MDVSRLDGPAPKPGDPGVRRYRYVDATKLTTDQRIRAQGAAFIAKRASIPPPAEAQRAAEKASKAAQELGDAQLDLLSDAVHTADARGLSSGTPPHAEVVKAEKVDESSWFDRTRATPAPPTLEAAPAGETEFERVRRVNRWIDARTVDHTTNAREGRVPTVHDVEARRAMLDLPAEDVALERRPARTDLTWDIDRKRVDDDQDDDQEGDSLCLGLSR